MTAPDNKNLSDDDYLDADFESDLPDLEGDLDTGPDDDFDDSEDLFSNPPPRKSRKKIIAGIVVATALMAGAGIYFIGGETPSQPQPLAQAQPIPQTDSPQPETPPVPAIPGVPVPASDFDTVEAPQAPPVIPATESPQDIPPEIPAADASISEAPIPEIPSIPSAEVASQPQTPDSGILPPEAVLADAPQVNVTTDNGAALPAQTETPATSENAAATDIKNEPINLDTVGETSVGGTVSTDRKEEKKPVEKDDFQKMVDRAQTVKPESKKNTAQVEYFDSPKGQSVRDLPPPSINRFTEPGQNMIIVNRSPTAGAVLEKSDHSDQIEARLVSARRASALGKDEAALEFYNEIFKQNPRDPRILMGRAVTYQKLGEDQKAISDYYGVLETQPENPEALTNLMGLIAKSKPAVALENLLNLRERFPRNPAVAAQLGVAYAQSGNPQDGLKYLQMAAQMEPDNAQHYYNMGVISEHMGDVASAIGSYEKSLDLSAVHGMRNGTSFTREQIYDRLSRLRSN